MLSDLLYSYGYDEIVAVDYFEWIQEGLIPSHSYLFGSWVSAGILGAIFWLWIFIFCLKTTILIYKLKSDLVPLVSFLIFSFMWDILFSPFNGDHRLYSAFRIVALIFISRQLVEDEKY